MPLLYTPTILFDGREFFHGFIRGIAHEVKFHVLMQHPLVFLESQHIVSTLLRNHGAGVPLAVHGICGDDLPLDVQIGQHLLEHRDFVGFLAYFLLSKGDAVLREIGCDDLQCGMRFSSFGSASYGLAVHSDDIALGSKRLLQDGENSFRQFLSVDDRQHSAHRRLGRDLLDTEVGSEEIGLVLRVCHDIA